MEGPFKGHAPTGEMVEFFGMAIFEVHPLKLHTTLFYFYCSCFVHNQMFSCLYIKSKIIVLKQLDEHSKIVKAEFFYDPGQLLEGLVKGKISDEYRTETSSSCPFITTAQGDVLGKIMTSIDVEFIIILYSY